MNRMNPLDWMRSTATPAGRLAEGVRAHGFRKWYERELLSGHAHMVLAFLCTIALMASMEAFGGGTVGEKLMDTAFVIVSAVIGVWALRRYLYLLMHAEEVANQANCPRCQAYGLFTVLSENRAEVSVRVCCNKCQQEWQIDG